MNEPWGFPLVPWQSAIATTKSGFYRVLVGPMDLLIPKTSKAVGKVMNQPYIFQKPAAVRDGLAETLGIGLVAAEGATHRVSILYSWKDIICIDGFVEAKEATDTDIWSRSKQTSCATDVGQITCSP